MYGIRGFVTEYKGTPVNFQHRTDIRMFETQRNCSNDLKDAFNQRAPRELLYLLRTPEEFSSKHGEVVCHGFCLSLVDQSGSHSRRRFEYHLSRLLYAG